MTAQEFLEWFKGNKRLFYLTPTGARVRVFKSGPFAGMCPLQLFFDRLNGYIAEAERVFGHETANDIMNAADLITINSPNAQYIRKEFEAILNA